MKYLSMDTKQAAIMAVLRNELELAEILSEGIQAQPRPHTAPISFKEWLGKGRFKVDDRGACKRVEAI